MLGIDFDEAIRLHNAWRRQFMNAFAYGSYADDASRALPQFQALIKTHTRFHALASEIQELSSNGMADAADLMLPQLADESHRLANLFDELRALQRERRS